TVPVLLIHGGKPVRSSLNIILYVDEAFAGPSLLPAGCHARAVARYWADFIDDTLVEAMYKAEGRNQAAAAIEVLEGALRECSKPFFGGDNAGYVDVVLGSLLPWVCAADATWGT
uniref:Glutathione S-transferase n=1 Tax=Triticum urartu TaxID=4572 RepID=A0A8R7PKR7_TRIUA